MSPFGPRHDGWDDGWMDLTPADDSPALAEHRRRRGALPAPVVVERHADDARTLLVRAGLGSFQGPVIVVVGGADQMTGAPLAVARAVLGPAIRLAAARTGAAVLDGGTAAGVMALVGEERAHDPAAMPLLLGVAPAWRVRDAGAPARVGRTALDANHSHHVLADSEEWGGEIGLFVELAEELAQGARIVMVVAGGGDGAQAEVDEAVAHGWPVLPIAGTGGVADELAARSGGLDTGAGFRGRVRRGSTAALAPPDPLELGRRLAWELQHEPTLKDAWSMFATFDALAVRSRFTFERFQLSVLLLGIVATAVALVHETARSGATRDVLHWIAVALPITISLLIALANRRAAGRRWVLLRGAAEAVKSEIYRYRTRTGMYAPPVEDGERDEARRVLAERLAEIDRQLVLRDATGGTITGYDGPLPPAMYGAEARDDGLSALGAADYVAIRLADQLSYYRGKVARLDRQRTRLQFVTLASGGAGALLAAAGAEVWVGLTTAVSGAALAQLAYLQIDNTIRAYNMGAAQLDAMVRDFRASDRSREPAYLDHLVTRGEAVLATELEGWVNQMTDALAQLQAVQAEAVAKVESEQIERIVDHVGARVTHAIEGPPLTNYEGFVTVDVIDFETGLSVRRDGNAALIDREGAYELTVRIAPDRREGVASEEIAIVNGKDEPQVPFEVSVDADSAALRAGEKALTVTQASSSAVPFAVAMPKGESGATLWVRVSQRGRLVQVVELELGLVDA
jgi:hypothetical protein